MRLVVPLLVRSLLGDLLAIRASGLWLVNELYKQPLSESDYEALKTAVLSTA
jgi:hypothetical protein